MGSPKLLLPWNSVTVIEQVLATWRASSVSRVVVTVHPQDVELARLCRQSGADVVVPDVPPPDMKTSVQRALAYVRERFNPQDGDVWLLAPADMPGLTAACIERVAQAYAVQAATGMPKIVVPVFHSRRGHPAAFPWELAAAVQQLADSAGINQLLSEGRVIEVECPERSILDDLDTTEDYRRQRPAASPPRESPE